MKWRIIDGGALRIRRWDDEAVVYSTSTGDTHLLHAPAAALLDALRHAPSDLDTLVAALAHACRCEVDQTLHMATEQLLAEMSALALIEAA